MCLVNVKGAKGLITGCTTPVTEGMEVVTENEVLTGARQTVLKLLLSAYYDSAYTHNDSDNELFKWAHHYGLDPLSLMAPEPRYQQKLAH